MITLAVTTKVSVRALTAIIGTVSAEIAPTAFIRIKVITAVLNCNISKENIV